MRTLREMRTLRNVRAVRPAEHGPRECKQSLGSILLRPNHAAEPTLLTKHEGAECHENLTVPYGKY